MEDYIAAVLDKLYLPKAVERDVEIQLAEEAEKAAASGESVEDMAVRLGSPAKLAQRYNDNYKKALQQRFRRVNLGILALAAILVLAFFIAFQQLFNYARERAMWMQAQLFQSQLGSFGPNTEGQGGGSPFGNGRSQDGQPASPFAPAGEPPAPTGTINISVMIMCATVILLCIMGINQLVLLKSRMRSYTLYLPPSREA